MLLNLKNQNFESSKAGFAAGVYNAKYNINLTKVWFGSLQVACENNLGLKGNFLTGHVLFFSEA